MVSLDTIKKSNESINSTYPPGLVAVFVGGTSGVGEATVKAFAQHAEKPRVYIIGRSQEAGGRIVAECKALNPQGTFKLILGDTSLMARVDEMCDEILEQEDSINLLFLSVGTLQLGHDTTEGLHYPAALTVYARNHFITRLLPAIKLSSSSLRRIVTVFGATFEGPIDMPDFQGRHMSRMAEMGHFASITTLALEMHHKTTAPEVGFVHSFPGYVESGIDRGSIGPLMRFLKSVYKVIAPLVRVENEESGERHLFLCTSRGFTPAGPGEGKVGDDANMGKDVFGTRGGGVWSVDSQCESAPQRVVDVLARLRAEGVDVKVKEQIDEDIRGALARR